MDKLGQQYKVVFAIILLASARKKVGRREEGMSTTPLPRPPYAMASFSKLCKDDFALVLQFFLM